MWFEGGRITLRLDRFYLCSWRSILAGVAVIGVCHSSPNANSCFSPRSRQIVELRSALNG